CKARTEGGAAAPGHCISFYTAVQFHRAALHFAAVMAIEDWPADRNDVRRPLRRRVDAVPPCRSDREGDAMERPAPAHLGLISFFDQTSVCSRLGVRSLVSSVFSFNFARK